MRTYRHASEASSRLGERQRGHYDGHQQGTQDGGHASPNLAVRPRVRDEDKGEKKKNRPTTTGDGGECYKRIPVFGRMRGGGGVFVRTVGTVQTGDTLIFPPTRDELENPPIQSGDTFTATPPHPPPSSPYRRDTSTR